MSFSFLTGLCQQYFGPFILKEETFSLVEINLSFFWSDGKILIKSMLSSSEHEDQKNLYQQ